MAEPPGYSATSQAVASLHHDNINMHKRLTEVQLENQVLRQQLYQVTSLLDIAVSKLGTMGVSLEAPIDVRTLRAEAMKRAVVDTSHAHEGPDLSLQKTGEQATSANKRFQLRVQLREHTKAVQCCAFFHGDEPLIVTGGLDCRLVLQDFFSGEKRWDATAHDENVSDVAWFDGTENILSASYDATVKQWDPRRGDAGPLYVHKATSFVLSATPLDKAFVFACSDARRRTFIVDTRTSKPISWENDTRVNSLAFDSATARLIMGDSDGVVSLWDIRRVGVALSSTGGNGVGPGGGVASAAGGSAGGMGTTPLGDDAAPPSFTSSLGNFSTGLTTTSMPTFPGHSANPSLLQPQNASAFELRPPSPTPAMQSGSTGPPVHCVSQFTNDSSHSAICYVAHYHSKDDTKRLVCVSGDNMVRVYRSNFNAPGSARSGGEPYVLRNVLPGVPARGYTVRAGFWKGKYDKPRESVFYDDGEKDPEQPVTRRLTECDLLVTGGVDNKATVFDVSEEGSNGVVEHLEGHRDRVTGAAVHHSDNRPIIATTSADSTVRIWVPVKT